MVVDPVPKGAISKAGPTCIRLDKWLWCARFFKTRGLASDAVKTGKVRVNEMPVKPSRAIRPGDRLKIRRGPYTMEVTVLGIGGVRRSAAEAMRWYVESAGSIASRELLEAQINAEKAVHPRSRGRPTKRDRRDLLRFKQWKSRSE